MAATIVWTEDPNQVDTHHGTVNGAPYWIIHPRYGTETFNLSTSVPRAFGTDGYGDTVDELKTRAQDQFDQFVALLTA